MNIEFKGRKTHAFTAEGVDALLVGQEPETIRRYAVHLPSGRAFPPKQIVRAMFPDLSPSEFNSDEAARLLRKLGLRPSVHINADASNETMVREGFWEKLKRAAANIDFVEEAATLFYCAMDSSTATWAKAVAFGALAYFIVPTDAIPDLMPGVGYTDDLGAVMAAIQTLRGTVTEAHRALARQWLGGNPDVAAAAM